MLKNKPNVITLMIGSNDVNTGVTNLQVRLAI